MNGPVGKKVVKRVPDLRFLEFGDNWVEKESLKLFSNSRKKEPLPYQFFLQL